MIKIKVKVYIPLAGVSVNLFIKYPEDYRKREIDDLVEKTIKDYLYNSIDFQITAIENE